MKKSKLAKKYSALYQKRITKVVEQKSETKKRFLLEKKVGELEQLIGQQQVQIQYFEKNSNWKSWNGSSPSDPNTA